MTPLEYFRANVVPDWDLSFHEVSCMLGLGQGPDMSDPQDASDWQGEQARLNVLSSIHRDLQLFTEDPLFSKRWLRHPNSAPLFGGLAPLDVLLRGDPEATIAVAGYVRSALGYDYS